MWPTPQVYCLGNLPKNLWELALEPKEIELSRRGSQCWQQRAETKEKLGLPEYGSWNFEQ